MSERAGIPNLWATEAEAAALSGMSYRTFFRKVAALEAAGFPQRNVHNGKRLRSAILAFWMPEANHGPAEPQALDIRQFERFTT